MVSFVDDGSSIPVAPDWIEARLELPFTLRRFEGNMGITNALNVALEKNDAEFILRMDADDRIHPERFKTQLRFMEQNQHVGVCGTGAVRFGQRRDRFDLVAHHDEILVHLLFANPFCHPTVCLRQSAIEGSQYPDEVPQAEDYLFWSMLASRGVQFANIPDQLLAYRVSGANSSVTNKSKRSKRYRAIQQAVFKNLFDDQIAEVLVAGFKNGLHAQLGMASTPGSKWYSKRALLGYTDMIVETAKLRPELFRNEALLTSTLKQQAHLASSKIRVRTLKNYRRFFNTAEPNWFRP